MLGSGTMGNFNLGVCRMTFRCTLALALALLVPACSALVAPDTTRLFGDTGRPDGSTGEVDAFRPDGALPDGGLPDTGSPDVGTPDGGPMCAASCDDLIDCTVDSCNTTVGVCVHAPSDLACGDRMRCSFAAGCVPILCTTNTECDDRDACNGAETCSPGAPGASLTTGCLDGVALDCTDEADCTEDHCNPASGCFHVPNDGACNDATACTTDTCTSGGCLWAPDNAMCNSGCRTGSVCVSGSGCTPGTLMSCGTDGDPCTSDPTLCDLASGMCLHPQRDEDRDGHTIARSGTTMCMGDDCDDMNRNVFPGATEICNGLDDNCEGGIDEGGVCGALPDTCATAQRIALAAGGAPGTFAGGASGNNTVLNDNYRPSCGGSGARDAVYFVDLPFIVGGAFDVTISTDHATTSFDTVVAAQVGGTCGTFGRACNDDVGGGNQRSTITFCVSSAVGATTRVHILVDGFDGAATSVGDYTVSVSVSPRASGVCG